jgi:nitrogen regulatory protein PII
MREALPSTRIYTRFALRPERFNRLKRPVPRSNDADRRCRVKEYGPSHEARMCDRETIQPGSDLGISGTHWNSVAHRDRNKGYGRKGYIELYRGSKFAIKFLPMIKIEVAVAAHQVEEAIDAIHCAAKASRIGDGKIFVFELDRVLSIHTDETGETVPPLAA